MALNFPDSPSNGLEYVAPNGVTYIYDASAKEWGKFFQRDEANDRRAFKLAEKNNEAMNKLSLAVKMNTKEIEENWKAVAEMMNLPRAKFI